MKKLLFLFAAVLLFACDKSDDGGPVYKDILGTWENITEGITYSTRWHNSRYLGIRDIPGAVINMMLDHNRKNGAWDSQTGASVTESGRLSVYSNGYVNYRYWFEGDILHFEYTGYTGVGNPQSLSFDGVRKFRKTTLE